LDIPTFDSQEERLQTVDIEISLPCQAASSHDHAGTRSYRPMPENSRPRVLLADDNADLLETLNLLLKPSCEVVELKTDSVEVLESVMTLKPDVVVLDLSMPGINGFDLCRQIKHATPETRIEFLTAFDDESFRNLAFSVGASAFRSETFGG
jgi:CheY-like chemotaxis protein